MILSHRRHCYLVYFWVFHGETSADLSSTLDMGANVIEILTGLIRNVKFHSPLIQDTCTGLSHWCWATQKRLYIRGSSLKQKRVTIQAGLRLSCTKIDSGLWVYIYEYTETSFHSFRAFPVLNIWRQNSFRVTGVREPGRFLVIHIDCCWSTWGNLDK